MIGGDDVRRSWAEIELNQISLSPSGRVRRGFRWYLRVETCEARRIINRYVVGVEIGYLLPNLCGHGRAQHVILVILDTMDK